MSVKEFQIIAKLGEGAYSSVYKVKRIADQSEYALKKVKLTNLSEKEKQNALNEVRILASVRCSSIVQYKEVFLDAGSNSLWINTKSIVMEYVNHGDLFQKIVDNQKKGTLIPEPEIWNIFLQVTKGLKSLHDLRIFHRDLKSANVFLNKDGTVKLGDMNVSKIAKKGLLYTQTGTPYYASPEVWKDQPYDQKSDIWSLGCVLYEMTTLKPPFRAEDMEGLYKKVIRGYYPKIPQCYSQDLGNVIRVLLQVAPHLRPSCDKILQLPSSVKRFDEKILVEADEGKLDLLSTIRIPKNMNHLTERLPKPNYTPLKLKKIEKNKFIQTLGIPSTLAQQDEEPEFKDNHSAEYNQNQSRLPKINKRSNAQERERNPLQGLVVGGHTPNRAERLLNESLQQNENSLIVEKRHKDTSLKHQGAAKINNEDILVNEKRRQQHNVSGAASSLSIDQYEKSLGINQIYGSVVKKTAKKRQDGDSKLPKPLRLKNVANLLDIEGESKQLSIKQVKKNQVSLANLNLRDESSLNDHDSSVSRRLPLLMKEKRQNLPTLAKNPSKAPKEEHQEYPERKIKQRIIEGRKVKDHQDNLLPDISRSNKQKVLDDDD